jgi:hypothetical protein
MSNEEQQKRIEQLEDENRTLRKLVQISVPRAPLMRLAQQWKAEGRHVGHTLEQAIERAEDPREPLHGG